MKWLDRMSTLVSFTLFAWLVVALSRCAYDAWMSPSLSIWDTWERDKGGIIAPWFAIAGLFCIDHLAMRVRLHELDQRYACALNLIESGSRLLGDAPVDSPKPSREAVEWKYQLQRYWEEVNWFCTKVGHKRQRYVTVGDDGEEIEERG